MAVTALAREVGGMLGVEAAFTSVKGFICLRRAEYPPALGRKAQKNCSSLSGARFLSKRGMPGLCFTSDKGHPRAPIGFPGVRHKRAWKPAALTWAWEGAPRDFLYSKSPASSIHIRETRKIREIKKKKKISKSTFLRGAPLREPQLAATPALGVHLKSYRSSLVVKANR
jgi:hypothetical protein